MCNGLGVKIDHGAPAIVRLYIHPSNRPIPYHQYLEVESRLQDRQTATHLPFLGDIAGKPDQMSLYCYKYNTT